jgi:acetyl esterase/lipase
LKAGKRWREVCRSLSRFSRDGFDGILGVVAPGTRAEPISLPMKACFFFVFLLQLLLALPAAEPTKHDIEYARVDGFSLQLDLYLPEKPVAAKSPLVVYVHGGGWGSGSKRDMPLAALVCKGFAAVSVNYRLSGEAPFPAQIHDIKAAIRFLRAHAAELGVDATRIAISGSSAGGHLAALVGVTNGVKDLEGTVGDNLTQSSDVQAIVSFFGASDLQTILGQSTPNGRELRMAALQKLLRCQPDENPELARQASPVFHVDPSDPPLLLIHGNADPQMPFEQSVELKKAYEAVHRSVRLEIIPGGKHGGREFYDERRLQLVANFLNAPNQFDE